MSEDVHLSRLCGLPTPDIGEARGGRGILPARIRPAWPGAALCGRVLPVHCPGGENLTLHHALYEARPDEVLVVATGEPAERGYWGEIMTLAALARGIAGLVIDACVRDVDAIEALRFPVFARGLAIGGTDKTGAGTIGGSLRLGDALVRRGDVVAADRDGIVVVPAGSEDEVVARVQKRQAKEDRARAELREGKRTLDIFGWPSRSSLTAEED